MVVDAGMGEVIPHMGVYVGSGALQKGFITGGIELKQGGPEHESPGPVGPAPAGIAAVHGVDQRPL